MILWVRHGESTWNAAGRLQGAELGPPLTDRGRAQAETTAEALAALGVTRLVASPAVRAQQTAEIVARRLGLDLHTDPLLLELGLDESHADAEARIDRFVAAAADTTVAVTHGDMIQLAIRRLSGRLPDPPTNGSIHAVDPMSKQALVWLG